MEYVVVFILLYLLYLAGNLIKNFVTRNPIIGEVMEGLDELHEE